MRSILIKRTRRVRRKKRIRKRVLGTPDRPRLTVFRSLKHIYAQVIDDTAGTTLCSASTRDKSLSGEIGCGGNKSAAARIGTALAEAAKNKGVDRVVLDRNGFAYRGRVKALADAVREGGVQF